MFLRTGKHKVKNTTKQIDLISVIIICIVLLQYDIATCLSISFIHNSVFQQTPWHLACSLFPQTAD